MSAPRLTVGSRTQTRPGWMTSGDYLLSQQIDQGPADESQQINTTKVSDATLPPKDVLEMTEKMPKNMPKYVTKVYACQILSDS